MGSQTACSGPLEINGIPAPNSYYQAASDPYLLCGKCSQSHFILAHTHTHKDTQTHTPCIQYVHAAWIACQTWLLFILYEDILTHTYKSSWNQVYVCVLNEEEINVYWSLKQRSSLLWIGPEVMAVNLWKLKLPSSGCEAQTHSNARMNMVGVNILYMKHSI